MTALTGAQRAARHRAAHPDKVTLDNLRRISSRTVTPTTHQQIVRLAIDNRKSLRRHVASLRRELKTADKLRSIQLRLDIAASDAVLAQAHVGQDLQKFDL